MYFVRQEIARLGVSLCCAATLSNLNYFCCHFPEHRSKQDDGRFFPYAMMAPIDAFFYCGSIHGRIVHFHFERISGGSLVALMRRRCW